MCKQWKHFTGKVTGPFKVSLAAAFTCGHCFAFCVGIFRESR